jgi:peptide/nickel transport system substrate-binding protein
MESRRAIDRLVERGLSRRSFLRMTAVAAGTAAVVPLLAACGDDDPTATPAPAATPAAATTPGAEPAATATPAAEATPAPAAEGRGGRLIHVRTADSDSLDPQRTVAGASWLVFSNIYDTLITKDMDLAFEGCIAESWEISEDGLEYTFNIRDGMTFHDGEPVTAEAVQFTFERAANPDAPAQALGFINAFESSDLVDEDTVLIRLSEPSAPFMSNIAVAYFGILSPTGVETHGAAFGTNPVGSGPWMFHEWREGEQITLVPFPDYQNPRSYVSNKGAPLADELVFRVIPEAGTQIAAMETGDANHIVLPNSELRNFENNPGYSILYYQGGTNIFYVEFATEQEDDGSPIFLPPFDDLLVRQAVAHAINADEIVDVVLEGIGDRNYGFMPTGIFAYDPAIEEHGYAHDLDRANELLDEAGWTLSGNVRQKDGQSLEVTMWSYADPTLERAIQVIQAQLAQAGIQVSLEVLDIGTMIARLPENSHNMDIISVGWPEADILYIMADIGWGVGNYNPPDYMELIDEARRVTDLDERKELYFEAQKLALEDVMAVPLWTSITMIMTREEVQGFYLGPDNINVWVDAWVEN